MEQPKLVPWPWQPPAVKAIVTALRKNGRALVVMATALGKTVTSALAIKKVDTRPVIFLAHSKDILRGAKRDYAKIFPNLKFGTFHGTTKNIEGADVVFASLQAMHRNLSKFNPRQFMWLIFDESHHAHAQTYKEVVEYFKCPRIALTATPDRMDMKDIRELFGEEVVNLPLEKAIAEGWLPRIEYHLVTDDALNERYLQQLAKQVLVAGERLPLDQIRKRLFVKTRDKKIAKIIEGYSEKTVVFCQSIAHANHFSRLFRSSSIYHSGQGWEKNKKALDDLRNGVVRRICVVDAFNEGIDVPDVGLVVFARTTQSETVFRQQLGRGLRRGKDKLIVLDFAGNIERIRMISRIVNTTAQIHEEIKNKKELDHEGYQRNPFLVSGRGFEFTFSKQIVDIERIFNRLEIKPYTTWQEASKVVEKLSIKTIKDYRARYKEDPRLVLSLGSVYDDFPGFPTFFGRGRSFYSTLQEAQSAVRRLGFQSCVEYFQRYKCNPQLPSDPSSYYEKFPGWSKFLGKKERKFYPTWESASISTKRLGIVNMEDYQKRYKRDRKLPASPQTKYLNFPSWKKFLGKRFRFKRQSEYYSTLSKAQSAVKHLGISSPRDYSAKYKLDSRLPSRPDKTYSKWPGWPSFLGTDK